MPYITTLTFLFSLYSTCFLGHVFAAAPIDIILDIAPNTIPPGSCFSAPLGVPLVNNSLPGPALRIPLGAIARIHVRNHLQDPFTMHWHGLSQKHTQYSDGVPFITQFPIPPGMARTYTFKVDEPGTYYYHAHTHLHAVTAYGALIVTNDNIDTSHFGYSDERILVIGDYYAIDVNQAMSPQKEDGLVPGHAQEIMFASNVPQGIHLNGKTAVLLDPTQSVQPACDPGAMSFLPDTTYRVRIIHAGGKVAHLLAFPKVFGGIRVIEADADLVESTMALDSLPIAPGQRYSVLVKAPRHLDEDEDVLTIAVQDMPTFRSWLPLHIEGDSPRHEQDEHEQEAVVQAASVTVTPITPGTFANTTQEPKHPPRPGILLSDKAPDMFTLLRPVHPVTPPASTRTLLFEIANNPTTGMYSINNMTFQPPATPLLHLAYLKRWDELYHVPGVFRIDKDEVVDLVVQFSHGAGTCADGLAHPFHIHSLRAYDMGSGAGSYDPRVHGLQLNGHGVRRDTFVVEAKKGDPGDTGCGWRVLRIDARDSTPGVWHAHCHFHDHMAMGMQGVLAVAADQLDLTAISDVLVKQEVQQGHAQNWPNRPSSAARLVPLPAWSTRMLLFISTSILF